MKVVVTGAAGFIGSNLVKGLNERGVDDIVAVDDRAEGGKSRNLADLNVREYVDAGDFYRRLEEGAFGDVEAVFHQGACSDTMEADEGYLMRTNYGASCQLFDACRERGTRLLYASSAAVYGGSEQFIEAPEFERPLNAYAHSKLLFDQHLRGELGDDFSGGQAQVVGLRYFNVYGPREQHKGRMASVAFHQAGQFREEGKVRLFGEYGGFGPGEQLRDFISIDDVVAVNLWFLDHPEKSGLFNLGTGHAQPFNDVALAVVNAMRAHSQKPALPLSEAIDGGVIEYIPFPDDLRGKYQCRTQADLERLRQAGCEHEFADVQHGVARYMDWLVGQSR